MRPTLGYGCLTTLGSGAVGGECDYPLPVDVRMDVVYAYGVLTGVLVVIQSGEPEVVHTVESIVHTSEVGY